MSEWPSTAGVALRQVRYQLLLLWRTPIAMFFTIVLPLVMLVVFNLLFSGEDVETPAGQWPLSQFYTGSIAAFTAVSATFTNLANTIPIRREEGVMKRWRGTPVPRWTYLAGFVGSATLLALAGSLLMILFGVVFYDVDVEPAKMPAALLTFVIGVAAFSAMGIALGSLVPNANAAPAAANAFILPLAFVSGVFIPLEGRARLAHDGRRDLSAATVRDVSAGRVQPARRLAGPLPGRLAVVAAWGVAGAVAAAMWFRWSPKQADGRSASRRRRRASADAGAGTGGSSEVVREA
ncbi:MAG: ABC transporter permease [Ilumatobacteraceae bacterium]